MDDQYIKTTMEAARDTDGDMTDIAHSSTQKVYRSSRLIQQTTDEVEEAKKTMPPTEGTPESRSAKERAKIVKIEAKHLYVIQAGLLTILLCVLAYIAMPLWAANMSAVVILATGIAAAIYLSQV